MILLRAHLLSAINDWVGQQCPNVTTLYGTEVQGVDFGDDGDITVRLLTDGRSHVIHTRLVLACDGKNSTVAKELLRAERESRPVASSKGAGQSMRHSPAVGMHLKAVVLDSNFTHHLDPPAPIADFARKNRVIVGDRNNLPQAPPSRSSCSRPARATIAPCMASSP